MWCLHSLVELETGWHKIKVLPSGTNYKKASVSGGGGGGGEAGCIMCSTFSFCADDGE